jgi:hypothetical protein
MNASVPISAVLIALAAAGALWLAYRWVVRLGAGIAGLRDGVAAETAALTQVDAELAALRSAMATGTAALSQLQQSFAPASEELRTNLASVPRILEMVSKIGSAQLGIMEAQRAEQAERLKNPFGRPNAPTPQRDTVAANREYDIVTMMRSEGVTREEAELRLNPANDSSVWSSSVLDGWR